MLQQTFIEHSLNTHQALTKPARCVLDECPVNARRATLLQSIHMDQSHECWLSWLDKSIMAVVYPVDPFWVCLQQAQRSQTHLDNYKFRPHC